MLYEFIISRSQWHNGRAKHSVTDKLPEMAWVLLSGLVR